MNCIKVKLDLLNMGNCMRYDTLSELMFFLWDMKVDSKVKIYEIWALNEENSNGMKYDASPHQQHFLSHLIKVAAALWTLSSVVSTKHSRKESLFGLLKDLMLSSATKLMTSSVFYSTMEVFVILYCSTYVIRCSKYKVRE